MKKLSKNKQARRDYLPPALAALSDAAIRAGKPMNAETLKMANLITKNILAEIHGEPDQTKYERDTLIWMLIDITGEPNADLFNEAIAEIKKLKEIREGATHWAGNAVHFQQEAGELRTLLGQLVSSDPCRLDHHGYCQEHMWVGKGECAHGRARKLLGYDTQ